MEINTVVALHVKSVLAGRCNAWRSFTLEAELLQWFYRVT